MKSVQVMKKPLFPQTEEAIAVSVRLSGQETSFASTTLEDVFVERVGRHLDRKGDSDGNSYVLWEKWVEFRRDFYKITLAAMIAPLLYIAGIRHGNPDHVSRSILFKLSDSRRRLP